MIKELQNNFSFKYLLFCISVLYYMSENFIYLTVILFFSFIDVMFFGSSLRDQVNGLLSFLHANNSKFFNNKN